ncbi:MAG: hypothetical protein M0Z68_07220 [Gammaproteobacteria bacterium]|nr:hypothetical protein [Gammaproteobacteria bacterium]
MSEPSTLEQLAQDWKGELREKNLAGRVLADYLLIRRLRAQNCPWHRIAASMPGVNPDSLRKVFRWVDKRVKEGDLEPPEGGGAPAKREIKAQSTQTQSAQSPVAATAKPAPGYHPSGRRLAPGETLRDDGLDF